MNATGEAHQDIDDTDQSAAGFCCEKDKSDRDIGAAGIFRHGLAQAKQHMTHEQVLHFIKKQEGDEK